MDGTALVRVDKRGKCDTTGGHKPEIRCRGLEGSSPASSQSRGRGAWAAADMLKRSGWAWASQRRFKWVGGWTLVWSDVMAMAMREAE
ncbi:hypothetical protein CCMA1212_007934 [Trichoderma ghanense]|uniref:Uncharacterized protein n=1 Tax=Trichoderma ghanense TaxID=65468 RepID=A0ABY2GWX4_9HYPO